MMKMNWIELKRELNLNQGMTQGLKARMKSRKASKMTQTENGAQEED